MEDKCTNLEHLAKLLKQKNEIEKEIARIIGRPAEKGHIGEYVAAQVFDIELEHSATRRGIDGSFTKGNLAGKTVNIKYYPKRENLLDMNEEGTLDFYLVLTGPKTSPASSKGTTRPWLISNVYLFDAQRLVGELKGKVKIGIATSVRNELWDAAEIYPAQRNRDLVLSDEEKELLALFREG